MRMARLKMQGQGCYYHVMNRVGGKPGEYPITDVDRERAFRILAELLEFYLVEVISVTWMGNHYHAVCYVGMTLPDAETIAARHNAYFGRRQPELRAADAERCAEVGRRMLDISELFGIYQQRFTAFFNRVHGRRGRLWGDRFKSVILEGERALWNCVKYTELNPVRATLAEGPEDYRFCSWGRYCGSGKHPFAAAFLHHMKRSLGDRGLAMTDSELFGEFRSELARTMAFEAESSSEEMAAAAEVGRRGESMPLRFLRRTRHWGQGAIIGSKAFVQETASMFYGRPLALRHQLSRGRDPSGAALYAFRRLKPTT